MSSLVSRAVALVLAAFLSCAAGAASAAERKATFVLVSDVYKMAGVEGRGGFARIAAAIKQERARNKDAIIAHAGDALSPCLMCSFDFGEHVVELMNRIGFDIFTPGNHEFDFGKQIYLKRMGEARFPIFAANMRGPDGAPLPGHKDREIRVVDDVKIGLVGLTAEDAPEKSNPGDLRIAGVFDALQAQAKALRDEGADVVVAVVHAQRNIDNRIHDLGLVDVLLSGDDHDLRYIYNGKSVLIEGAEDGAYVSALDLVFDDARDSAGRLGWRPKIRIIDTADVTPDPEVAARVAFYEEQLTRELDVPLATLAAPLDSRSAVVRGGEAGWGNLIADAIRAAAKADFAVMNGGGVRGGVRYEAGHRLTRRDVLAELPFGNKTLAFRLTGAQLREVMEHAYGEFPRPAGQFLHISGGRVVIDASRKPGARVTEFVIGGKPVDDAAWYTVAASDFFLRGGDGFPNFTQGALRTRVEDAQLIANDVMVHARRLATVDAKPEGRVTAR